MQFLYVTGMPYNVSHVLGKKATIYQVTTMLATSKNILFPGANHQY